MNGLGRVWQVSFNLSLLLLSVTAIAEAAMAEAAMAETSAQSTVTDVATPIGEVAGVSFEPDASLQVRMPDPTVVRLENGSSSRSIDLPDIEAIAVVRVPGSSSFEPGLFEPGLSQLDAKVTGAARSASTSDPASTLSSNSSVSPSSEPSAGDAPEATTPPVEPATEPTVKPDETPPDGDPSVTERPADLDPDQRQQLLIEGDRLWLQGRREDAEFLYRKAKNPFQAISVGDRPEPVYDPEQLSPAGRVYWREAEAGRATHLTTRVMVPLDLLTQQYPEFIPGNIRYAEVLIEQDQPDAALSVLERAATLYPDEPELIRARVTALAAQEQYLEASIAARQYALLNADQPDAPEFTQLADENLQEFQSRMRRRITGSAIANVLTGALSFALTGGFIGPLSAIQTSIVLLRGESAVGEGAAERISRRLELIEDEAVVAYVNELGQRVASVSGRSDFDYRFYVVRDDDLNAFALPGGKVFVNAGAILGANSEAELAGLLSHELSHAVLSHGFQLMTQGNATANLLDIVPYGGIVTDLAVLSYSRDMERQADALGTRMLATAGFAADGLRNLMVTLQEQEDDSPPFAWLSTHPDTSDRIRRMEVQIEQNGYNRYAYEGVERHLEMQERVRMLMQGPEETGSAEEANEK
ncbi:MAG: M48 family metalloprotease [Oculatellaceae cyanobacterium bins.114]|nr:M48 family metalloprotease [Oculatellaceae cyanobacterium bins.114]